MFTVKLLCRLLPGKGGCKEKESHNTAVFPDPSHHFRGCRMRADFLERGDQKHIYDRYAAGKFLYEGAS